MSAEPTMAMGLIWLLITAGLLTAVIVGVARLVRGNPPQRPELAPAPPPVASTGAFPWGAIAVIACLLVVAFVLFGLTFAVHEVRVAEVTRPAQVSSAEFVMPPTLVSPQVSPEVPVVPRPVTTPFDQPAQRTEESRSTLGNAGTATSVGPPETPLPAWTQQESKIVQDGHIPDVLVVRSSSPCSTESEAYEEALTQSLAALKTRLIQAYPQMASWNIPPSEFLQHSLRDRFTERRVHDFGSFQDTMYRVYLQFEDSPQVRERLVEAWERSHVNERVGLYAIGMGAATLALALMSVLFRMFGAASVSQRKRSAGAAAALLGATGVGLMVLERFLQQ